jgi:hypothetical protein
MHPLAPRKRTSSTPEKEFGDKYVDDLLQAGILEEIPTDSRDNGAAH